MLKYTSILKSRPYLYLELKKAASLITQGLSIEEIINKSIQENLFAVNSEAKRRGRLLQQLRISNSHTLWLHICEQLNTQCGF